MRALNTLVLALSLGCVQATRYYECTRRDIDLGFYGINQVCDTLGDNWCATNCNIFKKNCEYCEYIPEGSPKDKDEEYDNINKLESWCHGQMKYTNKIGTYVGGGELDNFRRPLDCPTCGGCSYHYG